jgi:hypothetical protein
MRNRVGETPGVRSVGACPDGQINPTRPEHALGLACRYCTRRRCRVPPPLATAHQPRALGHSHRIRLCSDWLLLPPPCELVRRQIRSRSDRRGTFACRVLRSAAISRPARPLFPIRVRRGWPAPTTHPIAGAVRAWLMSQPGDPIDIGALPPRSHPAPCPYLQIRW